MPPMSKKRGDARPLVGVIMGSRSDWETMAHAAATLEVLGVPHEVRVVSAHRTPDLLFEYADSAARRGLEVIIAAAGGAAHLPGMTAAKTPLARARRAGRVARAQRARFPALDRPDAGRRAGRDARHRPRRARSTPRSSRPRSSARSTRDSARRSRASGPGRRGRCSTRPIPAPRRRPPDAAAPRRPAAPVKVGVLGGGQLGWMLARAGDPLGIRCRFLDPSPEAPAGRAGELVVGAYDDPVALGRFAEGLDARHVRVRERPRRDGPRTRRAAHRAASRPRRSRWRRTDWRRSGSSSRSTSPCRPGAPWRASPISTAPSPSSDARRCSRRGGSATTARGRR